MNRKLYLVKAIPAHPRLPEILSFFSTARRERGDVIVTSIGKLKCPILVISCNDIETHKSELKGRGYQLRRLAGRKILVLPEEMISQLDVVSNYYLVPRSYLLYLVLPRSSNRAIYRDEDKRLLRGLRNEADYVQPGKPDCEISVVTPKDGLMLAPETQDLVLNKPEGLLLIASRKGLAPETVCADCGSLLECPNCFSPMVLRGARGKTYFACVHCSHREAGTTRCKNCSSWKLKTLGFGQTKIQKETGIKTLLLQEAVNSKKMSTNTVVVTIDSILALPDFSISKRVFTSLWQIACNTKEKLLIQTRKPNEPLFKYLLTKNYTGFMNFDDSERKRHGCPPFKVLFKIIHSGDNNQKSRFIIFAKKLLGSYNPTITEAFVPIINGKHRTLVTFKIDKDKWPEERLARILSRMKEVATVEVDPVSLL